MINSQWGFGTKAIHAGNRKDEQYGALATPIYQTATFVFDTCEQGGNRFAQAEKGYIYSRLGNPTVSILEDKLAVLEGGEAGIAVSSGMGAISSTIWTLCRKGAHIIADSTLYGCTYAFLAHGISRYGVDVTFINSANINEVKKSLRPDTKIIYFETPANPNLKITDISKVASIAHDYNPDIKVICDNTFCSPYLQRPLELGCDIVVHSGTKYLNGHGDVVAGFVIGKNEVINQIRLLGVKDMTGAVLGPFEAYLVLRGLKTLDMRMERHCSNAEKIVSFLENSPAVRKIYYPGRVYHEGHEVAKRQMVHGFGGMVSFELNGDRKAGAKLINSLKMCKCAVSLGDAETLIEHPASMTHSTYSSEELLQSGIPESLVRISAGLENHEDIINDLKRGLAGLEL